MQWFWAQTENLMFEQAAYVQTCNHQARKAGRLILQWPLAFLVPWYDSQCQKLYKVNKKHTHFQVLVQCIFQCLC